MADLQIGNVLGEMRPEEITKDTTTFPTGAHPYNVSLADLVSNLQSEDATYFTDARIANMTINDLQYASRLLLSS